MVSKTDRIQVVVVGGGPRGFAMLKTAAKICERSRILKLSGYIADNPQLDLPGRSRRYSWYQEFNDWPCKLLKTANRLHLPCYNQLITGSYKIDDQGYSAFQRWLFEEALQRELGDCKKLRVIFIMACFGQRWTCSTIELAKGWFINTHPVAFNTPWDKSNLYRGPIPYEKMNENGAEKCELVAHTIDKTFDNGCEIFRVGPASVSKYDGRMIYERSDPVYPSRTIMCRPRTLGQYVYGMHVKMAPWTSKITKKILTSKQLLDVIREGQYAKPKLLRELFGVQRDSYVPPTENIHT